MNDTPGFPAPTLPPPGSAPRAPSPAPVTATPTAPATSPSEPLTAPSPSGFTLPTLPSVAAPATTRTEDVAAATGSAPVSAPEAVPAVPVPSRGTTPRGSAIGKLLPIVLVLGAGAIGYVGFTNLSSGDSVESTPATTAPVPTSPLLVPIVDATQVVDAINDDSEEQEALDDLGLGPRGAPPVTEAPRVVVDDRTVGAAIALIAGDVIADDLVSVIGAPTFKYEFRRGSMPGPAIWVDATTGNRELFDGTTYVRVVAGASFHTTDPTGAWVADPAVGLADPLALLTGMVMVDTVLPAELLEQVVASTAIDGSADGRYLFIDTELAAVAPELRSAWLAAWGFDPAITPVEVDGFVDAVPDAARAGLILVTVEASADGVVTAVRIDAPATGPAVTYRLLGASTTALSITPPGTAAG